MFSFRIFTARKRSLGQGNIFRSVCQEFCPRGGGGGGVLSQHALQVVSQHALQQVSRGCYPSMPCSRSPGGGGACSGGSALRGCLVETPPGQLLLRAVRILLECILVKTEFNATILNNHNWEYFVQQFLSLELHMCNKQIFSTSIFMKLRRRSKTAADPGFIQCGVPRKIKSDPKRETNIFL